VVNNGKEYLDCLLCGGCYIVYHPPDDNTVQLPLLVALPATVPPPLSAS
jgi:hypothetical protein